MIVSKIEQGPNKTFFALVADTESEQIGVSEFKSWPEANEFRGFCHMTGSIKYDDGQGREYDILDSELQ